MTMRGVTVADFEGEKISAFRQYWDEVALLEQLGLLPVEGAGPVGGARPVNPFGPSSIITPKG